MPSRLAALHGSAGLACYVETQTHQALLYDRLPSPNRIIAPIPFTVRWIWDANKNKTSEAIVRMMSDYRLTIPSGGYDDADRLTSWNRSDGLLELSWDFENKLHPADTEGIAGGEILQRFEALGRRTVRDSDSTTTIYGPSGQQTLADYQAGTATTGSPTYTYVYGSYIDKPVLRTDSGGDQLYYHRNGQYSVIALTDATGSISERYAYDAYGKLTVLDGGGTVLSNSAYDNRYTYTGREWTEELALYHYRARMYDPVAGRFCSRDPIGYKEGQSLYRSYFGMSRADPFGLESVDSPSVSILHLARQCLQHPFGSAQRINCLNTLIEAATDPRVRATLEALKKPPTPKVAPQPKPDLPQIDIGVSIAICGKIIDIFVGPIPGNPPPQPRQPSRKPISCTEQRLAELQEAMHATCDNLPGRSCGSKYSQKKRAKFPCSEIRNRIGQQITCKSLREDIQIECYAGSPDPEHDRKIQEADEGIKNCRSLEKINCANGHPMSGL